MYFKQFDINGIPVYYNQTTQFKTVSISIKMKAMASREDSTKRSLLASLMRFGTLNHPNLKFFNQYLDSIYGMKVSSFTSIQGHYHTIDLTSMVVNERYLPVEESLFKKQLGLLSDMVYRLNCHDGQFNQINFDLAKRQQIEQLESLKDDKASYAYDRLLEEMSEGQGLSIRPFGYLEDLIDLTSEQMYDYYRQSLNQSDLEIYIVGDVLEEQLQWIKDYFIKPQVSFKQSAVNKFISEHSEKEIIELNDLAQTKIGIGYAIDAHRQSDKHLAAVMLNGIIGGFAHSKLFRVVRETHSLAYTIYSSYSSLFGMLTIQCGVNHNKVTQAIDLIKEQINAVKNGDISDEEMNFTYLQLMTSYKKIQDHPFSMIDLKQLSNIIEPVNWSENYLEKLSQVTKEDIV